MKRLKSFTAITVICAAVVLVSCSRGKENPGRVYMPDMAYSRAVESYALLDSSKFTTDVNHLGDNDMIFYNSKPVEGTISVGEMEPFAAPLEDSAGGLYTISNATKNPLPALAGKDSLEAARLFNIYCAVCHGAGAGNNGPVSTKVGGVKNILTASPTYSDGRLFHIINYGQGNMGSYASQLSRKQRWMIIQYIRTLEPKPEGGAAAAIATPAPATPAPVVKADSSAKKTK
jgi:mono/diheme cytochrome c family protein